MIHPANDLVKVLGYILVYYCEQVCVGGTVDNTHHLQQVKCDRRSADQSVDDLVFDSGQHPFKLLRLRGDHGWTQVSITRYRSEGHTW